MSADNYTMDLQFKQVSRRRQGSSPKTLSIQSGPSSLPPFPSTTLLCPSSVTPPSKRAASPAASSSKSPIPRNPSSFSEVVRPKVFQPKPPIQGNKFSRPFKPLSFNYGDYTNAWSLLFWLQAYNHSWFLTFFEVQHSYHLFQQSIYSSPFSKTFRYALYFQIPWISCWNYQLGPSDWFKDNVHLQNMTHQEDEAFLLTKNVVMSSLAGVGSQEEFNFVVNTVVVRIFDPYDL
ncbi:Retrotransposable element Tf2 [Cucumis melo var. makuwa]|uniref:Retrotransposable element Tf2 n=1 Tax=Cucumis melo var. makuwa TaxID=1194695 RepID=A0A5D3BTA8_CUCMM|nr:Retrotransposable element Tf2 [Cucumis melo var. makuwa]TYK02384.1 Retrotransposable element Tf2 [Cucumis melo var. makuwa]